jgi:hypothetical protein
MERNCSRNFPKAQWALAMAIKSLYRLTGPNESGAMQTISPETPPNAANELPTDPKPPAREEGTPLVEPHRDFREKADDSAVVTDHSHQDWDF